MKQSFIYLLITTLCLFGAISAGNIIGDNQNSVLVFVPTTANSPRIDVRFILDDASPGVAFNQFFGLAFPANVATDLQFDQDGAVKYSCSLTDGTTTYTLTAEKPASAENSTAYCKLTDTVNSFVRGGLKNSYKFTLTFNSPTRISSNYVRSVKFFTSTSARPSKIIIDQISFLGNIALYSDPKAVTTKAIEVSSSQLMSGSTAITSINPSQTIDVTLNIKSNIFIAAADVLFTFKYDKNLLTGAQSVISGPISTTSTDALSAAVKGSLSLSTNAAGDTLFLAGLSEDLIPGRQFQLSLKSWKATDKPYTSLAPLEMIVYYKNTYSIISQTSAGSTSNFKINTATVTLTADHPDGWDIFRNGVFPMKYTFQSNLDFPSGAFVLLQHSNFADGTNRYNFVASTCDFSDNDASMDQGFGKRPQCYPLRTDFNYPTGQNANGSGIFFYMKSITANKSYVLSVWGSADNCGGNTTNNFNSAVSSNTAASSAKFSFQMSLYSGISAASTNESRFVATNMLGQSTSQSMKNKCWNAMTQVIQSSLTSSTSLEFAPTGLPYRTSVLQTLAKMNAPNAGACTPPANCGLTHDVNLYKEINEWRLINVTTDYAAGNFLLDVSGTPPSEFYIYGGNAVTASSYFALTFTLPVFHETKIYENIPSPIAHDGTVFRSLPGRLELKVQKTWFTTGDSVSGTKGCYFAWGLSDATAFADTKAAMQDVSTAGVCAAGLDNGGANFISSKFTNAGCSTYTSTIDTTNSKLATTDSYFRILSVWNNSGTAASNGSNHTGGISAIGFPVKNAYITTSINDSKTTITMALFSTCLKWNPPASNAVVKNLYTNIDIQLNWRYSTSATFSEDSAPNRSIRFVKLFPEGGVFQDIDGASSKKVLAISGTVSPPDQYTDATKRSFKLHYSTGASNDKVGVCLIEIYGKGINDISDGNSNTLAIWIGFGVILETDYNDISSTYPVAPLANTSSSSYGLQSGYFMHGSDNFHVLNSLSTFEFDSYVNDNGQIDNAGSVVATAINKFPLRSLLMTVAYTGKTENYKKVDYVAGKTDYTPAVISPSNRSSYLFLMGSVVLVNGFTSGTVTSTTSSVVNNLLIPIYCPIHNTTNNTIKHYNGLPTLYIASLTMSAYNNITSLNKIYSHYNLNDSSAQFTVITTSAVKNGTVADYYRDTTKFTNAKILNDSATYINHLVTLRWAPYTSTITNPENILYVYYANVSSTFAAQTINCTGHVLLINSTNVTVDSTLIDFKGGISNSVAGLYNGAKKFYYLGFEFNKAVMVGLNANNPTFGAAAAVGVISGSSIGNEDATLNFVGVKRPSIDNYFKNGSFVAPSNSLGYFCNSAHYQSPEALSNFVGLFSASTGTKYFLVDFNPGKTTASAATFQVTIGSDKSAETIYKADVAGNTKLSITFPGRIPGGVPFKFSASNTIFTSNTICGLVTSSTRPVVECSSSSNVITCTADRTDNKFDVCCYNISYGADPLKIDTLFVSLPTFSSDATRLNVEKLYDALPQFTATAATWTTANAAGVDVINTLSSRVSKFEYQQVVQDSGIGKVIFTVSLPREPTRNMAITFVGDFSSMLVQNNIPRCVATFGSSLGANWDTSGDVLIDGCDVSSFNSSTSPIVITTKNIVYKCGLSFSSKILNVSLWPVIVGNWSTNPLSNNSYRISMTLNDSGKQPVAASTAFSITGNVTYLPKPLATNQWDSLCTVSSVVPRIPGEYADYQFDFDLDTNKTLLGNATPNEVSIFFNYNHYGSFIQKVLCFYNTALMNCSFTDEGILNIRFSTPLTIGSGKKISIIISGIYNPTTDSDIYFPCTVNNTNFSTGVRNNLITGSGKLTGGFAVASTTTMGALRFMNGLVIQDSNPRNTSTHTFKVTFDSGINLTTLPLTIANTPQIIITFPKEYNLAWFSNVKATASIDEYTSDTANNIVKGQTIIPANVLQSGNRVTIILPSASTTFNTNWRYWEIKVSNIVGPTDSSSTIVTTSPYNVVFTNSNYSAIYRTYQNLNNLATTNMSIAIDNWIQSNRGGEFKFDNTKWVIDISTGGVPNMITIRPGRFIPASFLVKTNNSNSIAPRAATMTLEDQTFKLADNSYALVTAQFQPTNFFIGAPCGTAPGNYLLYFGINGDSISTFFAPLVPVQVTVDASTTGVLSFNNPAPIPSGASTYVYITISEPNVDALNVTWSATDSNSNDSTSSITAVEIPAAKIKAGTTYNGVNAYTSVFAITNIQAKNNQVYRANNLNACYTWSSNTLTIIISGTQAIIPNLYDFSSSFVYSNADTDVALTSSRNAVKFVFTPPYSPIYVYCALVCFNRSYPSDDVIRSQIRNNNSDTLTQYYTSMFSTKTASNIIFDNLIRGLRYKLRCIISSTEGTVSLRTATSTNLEQITTTNGTVSYIIPSAPLKTQCVQYYFTSDPGQATKIAMVNYCQRLYSANGFSASGCIICTDSGLTYTSPGISLPTNITCTATAAKAKLRFLQTITPANSTVLTPTTAGSTVNPSLVNQSNPITFSVCPVQHPICPTDITGNKLYSDFFNQLIADTRTTALFTTNLGIVNVPVNNTLIVTDLKAPDVSKDFTASIISLNANGLVQFSASYTSALRCSWQIAETSAAPTTGAQVDQCTDSQWCGKNFNVGTLVANTSTNPNNLKAFGAGKSYAVYMACYNDVPYSTSISNVYALNLSIPNNVTPAPPVTPITNTTTVSASNVYFSFALLFITLLLF